MGDLPRVVFLGKLKNSLGHYIGFYEYAHMFCLNAYMNLRVCLQRKGGAITFQDSRTE